MNKILLIIALFLAAVIKYQSKKIDALTASKTTLEANNQILTSRIEREHNDKVELSRKIAELEELAKTDTSFNWGVDISNTAIVKRLRENAGKVY